MKESINTAEAVATTAVVAEILGNVAMELSKEALSNDEKVEIVSVAINTNVEKVEEGE